MSFTNDTEPSQPQSIRGTFDSDLLMTGGGDDVLAGDAGDDILLSGAGDDDVYGEAGFDVIDGGDGDDDIFGAADNDILSGGNGDDTLAGDNGVGTGRGDLGADRLDGGDGDDILLVGEGLDTLTGGSGADRFEFRFSNPLTPLAAGTGAAFTAITDFSAADDTLFFDVAGLGRDGLGANFLDGSGGVVGGTAASFYSGSAAGAGGQRVVVLTDQAYVSGAAAIQATANERAGDFVLYFNSTVNTGSLLVVSAPDAAASIARFTDTDTFAEFAAVGFTASDFVFG